jgi:hypothetical protein
VNPDDVCREVKKVRWVEDNLAGFLFSTSGNGESKNAVRGLVG